MRIKTLYAGRPLCACLIVNCECEANNLKEENCLCDKCSKGDHKLCFN
jgi:hypothetical protein